MNIAPVNLPSCPICGKGTLLPLSDYAAEGSSVVYKAWACSQSVCGHVIRVDKGQVTYERIGGRAEHQRAAGPPGASLRPPSRR